MFLGLVMEALSSNIEIEYHWKRHYLQRHLKKGIHIRMVVKRRAKEIVKGREKDSKNNGKTVFCHQTYQKHLIRCVGAVAHVLPQSLWQYSVFDSMWLIVFLNNPTRNMVTVLSTRYNMHGPSVCMNLFLRATWFLHLFCGLSCTLI